jgi:hypothetical protein
MALVSHLKFQTLLSKEFQNITHATETNPRADFYLIG